MGIGIIDTGFNLKKFTTATTLQTVDNKVYILQFTTATTLQTVDNKVYILQFTRWKRDTYVTALRGILM